LDPALAHLEFGPTIIADEVFVAGFGDSSTRY
jgi:hypothetical protein